MQASPLLQMVKGRKTADPGSAKGYALPVPAAVQIALLLLCKLAAGWITCFWS